MKNSRGNEWQTLRKLEDVLAILADVNEARAEIKREAWRYGIEAIFEATNRQQAALERLKETLSQRWHELMEQIDDEED